MGNVRIVVEGFKEAVDSWQEFLGFERVEEYPHEQVISRLHQDLSLVLRHFLSQPLQGHLRAVMTAKLKELESEPSDLVIKHKEPSIIIIGSLLEKVHNFGHILRTLHGHNAMLVVPSAQPLAHPECRELVPEGCDVEVIEIKDDELIQFMRLQKERGFPLIGLEQCSTSFISITSTS